jgi:C4-dicarboxylate-specific signal transduction histidine kinase
MEEQVKSSMIEDLIKANNLLYENMDNLPYFITSERKGKLLMQFYVKMGASVEKLQTQLKYNTRRLSCKVGSINEIIEAQQNYAGVNTVPEELALEPILEDAVKVNSVALEKYRIEVTRDYRAKPRAMIQRAKLFFVLVNLINNAKDAMVETPADERKLQLEMFEENDCKCIRITDSGCGLSGEMRKRLFDYGFSTKSGRHGFGLHCSASYMAEMGGTLTAASDEPGKGASFLVKFNDVVSG